MRRFAAAAGVWFLAGVSALPSQNQNLWEWMNVAPIVALVEVREQSGAETVVRVEQVFRGDLAAGGTVALDVRGANRDRAGGVPSLDLRDGVRYLALLEPATGRRRNRDKAPLFRLVRGVEGVKEVPSEGAPAWIDAAQRISAIRALGNDALVWDALGTLLIDENPVLVRAALGAHAAFQRGGPELYPALSALVSHPNPAFREEASRVAQICIRRDRGSARTGEGRELVLRLIALARRDPDPAVRASATRALGEVRDESTAQVLAEVAERDPEQEVRFEAKRILFERSADGGTRRD